MFHHFPVVPWARDQAFTMWALGDIQGSILFLFRKFRNLERTETLSLWTYA
jgi:hypothetical protein